MKVFDAQRAAKIVRACDFILGEGKFKYSAGINNSNPCIRIEYAPNQYKYFNCYKNI